MTAASFAVPMLVMALVPGIAHPEVAVDIRVAGQLTPDARAMDYVATISDCTNLTSIELTNGGLQSTVLPNETDRVEALPLGCQISFTATGADRLNPGITLNNRDGSVQVHTEAFAVEANAPALTFDTVGLQLANDQQHLITRVTAFDDTDISYIGFSVTGIRASELRAAGGVIDKARETAFAATRGTVRVYPQQEGQSAFSLALPVNTVLDSDVIAHDGVVLLDLVAVDASGNRKTVSKIAFTGNDVAETAQAMVVSPSRILFTNLLETATIVPSVQFQFRGLTALPGSGAGVQYSSSNPDLIAVSNSGVVYPLAETAGQAVTISVTYPGLPAVEVPVETDLSKTITGLQVDAVNANGSFVLPRLNQKVTLPKVFAVFSDGTRSEIGSQFPLSYALGPGTAGILELDDESRLIARAIFPADAPAVLNISLANQPAVSVALPIEAVDALPDVSFKTPSSIEAGATLSLDAQVSDDVGIREVRFLMDGAVVGVRDAPPYSISVSTSPQMANRTLDFTVVAIDSAGQSFETPPQSVSVVTKATASLPDIDFEKPVDLQRFVEGTPMLMRLALPLDGAGEITYVDFF
ncbi:MAG TPA: hypothetical protein ENI83_02530, partial [Gammaproteobacteria bacterium]|nr:hypothetical protein [Gammaproteobacteria bacterium]